MVLIFVVKYIFSCPLNKILSPLKYVKRKINLGYSYQDYDSAKINFDNDYHKTNPADVNHEKIIQRKDESVLKELDEANDYELTSITENVLNYANRHIPPARKQIFQKYRIGN